jgi:hypothetical protein
MLSQIYKFDSVVNFNIVEIVLPRRQFFSRYVKEDFAALIYK